MHFLFSVLPTTWEAQKNFQIMFIYMHSALCYSQHWKLHWKCTGREIIPFPCALLGKGSPFFIVRDLEERPCYSGNFFSFVVEGVSLCLRRTQCLHNSTYIYSPFVVGVQESTILGLELGISAVGVWTREIWDALEGIFWGLFWKYWKCWACLWDRWLTLRSVLSKNNRWTCFDRRKKESQSIPRNLIHCFYMLQRDYKISQYINSRAFLHVMSYLLYLWYCC